jgi:hypothetical protein
VNAATIGTDAGAANIASMLRTSAAWMRSRGWHRLLAKQRDFSQSLYHHTLAELDVLATLAPMLMSSAGWALTFKQFQALFVANLCHDVGKEDPAWQRAVARGQKAPDHVHHLSTRTAIQDWSKTLGYADDPGFSATVAAAIGLHHKATQGAASTLDLVFHGALEDPRWRELADLVEAVDKTCSRSATTDASVAAREYFGPKVAIAFHRVQILRGVSTALLHQACEDVYQDLGWRPLLHFPDGTVYAAPGWETPAAPSPGAMKERAGELFRELLEQCNLGNQVVGNPVADMFPKPELFNAEKMPDYLDIAAKRMSTSNFMKKHRKKAGFSKEFIGAPGKQGMLAKYCRLAGVPVPATDQERDQVLQRLAAAVPLDATLRFYKAVLLGDKLFGRERWPEPSAYDAWLAALKADYETELGKGSFAGLEALTNDPAANLAKAIDPFLNQPVPDESISWVSKPLQAQQAELKRRLIEVFDASVSRLPPGILAPPLDGRQLGETFTRDLLLPDNAPHLDAAAQLRAYGESKDGGGSAFCPWSNEAHLPQQGSGSDLGLSTDGHTNRLPIQGKTWKNRGGVAAALPSRYELMLRRLLLGRPPAQLLVMMPPAQFGLTEGEHLVEAVAQLEQEVMEYSRGFSPNPTRRFSFQYTDQIAGRLAAGQSDLVSLLEYDSPKYSLVPQRQGDKVREGLAELDRGLRESFQGGDAEGLAELNAECQTDFRSWKDAVEAIYVGQSSDARKALAASEEVRARRAAALRLYEPGTFVCRTPNLIFVLLPEKIAVGKENDANAAIRQLFLSLVVATALSVSVALIEPEEALTFTGGEGAVRVPLNAALRAQISRARMNLQQLGKSSITDPAADWLLPHEVDIWLHGLLAVHQLARVHHPRDPQRRLFPDGSCLYDILCSRSAGALLRRIEAVTGQKASATEMQALEVLEPFLD